METLRNVTSVTLFPTLFFTISSQRANVYKEKIAPKVFLEVWGEATTCFLLYCLLTLPFSLSITQT